METPLSYHASILRHVDSELRLGAGYILPLLWSVAVLKTAAARLATPNVYEICYLLRLTE